MFEANGAYHFVHNTGKKIKKKKNHVAIFLAAVRRY
jgi:hypothetical protein